MAYHEISRMDAFEVIRRWHAHQSISQIARSLGYDRKTVRGYVRQAQRAGLSPTVPLPAKEVVLDTLRAPACFPGRVPRAQSALEPYLAEIAELVNHPELPLKAKTAFEVITERHALGVSYPSFKRFVQTHRHEIWSTGTTTCRMEVPAGSEVQVDYCLIGLWRDPVTGGRRRLYAFIGTLSHSRHKYVELTLRQDQVSFAGSHVRMFESFGGVPARALLDNLKSGVLTPDLYDPHFNHSFRELAEHYGLFLDPARVRRPKDKAKVERDVQTVREAVRKLMILNPGASLAELNHLVRRWVVDEYGSRVHGSTGERPYQAFHERERPSLKPLPEQSFELATWKLATVHPDHYIQFRGKAYSVPHAYVGRQVWVRATERLLQIYHDDRLVKQHVITARTRHTDFSDFPPNVQHVLDVSTQHKRLLARAERIGPEFGRLIRDLLEVHAFMNLRRSQGLVATAEDAHSPDRVERAARFIVSSGVQSTPHNLRHILERLAVQEATERPPLPLSDQTLEFVREASYFIRHEEEAA